MDPMLNRSPRASERHMPVLDGVRAIAVLGVICFHFWQVFAGGPYTLLGKFAAWGQIGVDLFFVLSGFLITGILLDSKGSDHFLRNFYVRRILRIFPLYYTTLFTFYFIFPVLHLSQWTPWRQSLWFWIYLQNLPMTFAPSSAFGPEHFWSLAVEEHFYLFWPVIVLLLNRDKLLRVIAFAIALSVFTRIVFIEYATFYFTLSRLDGLAIGAALAIFARQEPEGLSRFVPWARWLLGIVGLILASTQPILSGHHLPAIQVVKSTLIAAFFASFMVLAVENRSGRMMGKALSGRTLGSIGKYSYGMYIFHPFILILLQRTGLRYNFLSLIFCIIMTYSIAWVSWNSFEVRFLRLKSYFPYTSNQQSALHLVAVGGER
jgi:peptidoglycan/LPS O-acetylase OafA/YrhL